MTTFMPYKSLTRSCIYKIVSDAYKGLKIPINIKHIGGHSLRHACASNLINNGVSLKEIDLNTMESKIEKNFFIIGDLLDAYGKCGGYNLSLAFLTGLLAGEKAQND